MFEPSPKTDGLSRSEKKLFLRVQSGEATPAELARYDQLKQENTRVRRILESMEGCWDQLFEYPIELNPALDLQPADKRLTSNRGWQMFAIAATLACISVLLFFQNNSTETIFYQTAYNQHMSQQLSDRSTVHLNASSRVEVNINDRERRVVLSQGEALFDVAKDATRKFVVETPFGEVLAVGTQFNVNLLSESLVVTIVEGTVMVSAPEQENGSLSKAEVATVNQSVVVDQRHEISTTDVDDTAPVVAWRQGKLVFSGQALSEALEIAGRHSQHRITILDNRLSELPVHGIFNSGDTIGLLAALESSFPLVAISEGPNTSYLAYRAPSATQR